MVSLGILRDPGVRRWLGGLAPTWTLLDQGSFQALQQEPSSQNRALRLASDLTSGELAASAVARNTLILLGQAAEADGLKLTVTGNLSRAVVAEMVDLIEWPSFDRNEAFRFHKVVNEPDFLPLFFVRQVAELANLVAPERGHLRPTPFGRKMLDRRQQQALQAILFHLTFWHADLGFLGRGLHGSWPQADIGVVLWSLSIAASDWQSSETLTRLCTIPERGVVEATWDIGSLAMEARVLRPLLWFGLLDYRSEKDPDARVDERHCYRKTSLFDRFLSFEVVTDRHKGVRH
jgi:hypothetical protein